MKKDNTIIELKNVWKSYKIGKVSIHAIRGINLKIRKGEFVAITGISGSGKSTMMHLVGCLDTPTQGSILLEGKDIFSLDSSQVSEIRGKKIGFVFQQFNLIPTLSALENVTLPMEFQDEINEDIKERGKMLLDLVGLKNRMNHKPTELSGGQAQRVAIARSLSNNPEIILADEPTGNLDSKTGKYIMNFLYKLYKNEGKTVIIVTHDLKLARFAKRIVQLKDGKIEKEIHEY